MRKIYLLLAICFLAFAGIGYARLEVIKPDSIAAGETMHGSIEGQYYNYIYIYDSANKHRGTIKLDCARYRCSGKNSFNFSIPAEFKPGKAYLKIYDYSRKSGNRGLVGWTKFFFNAASEPSAPIDIQPAATNQTNQTPCADECSSGLRVCSGSYLKICSNYDSATCSEWSQSFYCPYGCSYGSCKPAPQTCHTEPIWNLEYCTQSCKCDAGEGDCATDDECSTGYCAKDVGAKYGQSSGMDVCELREYLA